jgi:hypothetical protein
MATATQVLVGRILLGQAVVPFPSIRPWLRSGWVTV